MQEGKTELKVLYLTLSKLPFDVMFTGEKEFEFRFPSKWILSRLKDKNYDVVHFRNGYGKNKPYFIAKYEGWEILESEYRKLFSNFLQVKAEPGTIKIKLGKIIEYGNFHTWF